MVKKSNTILISIIITAFIIGTLTANPVVEAASPVATLLTDLTFGLEAIKNAIDGIDTETDKIPMIKDDVTDIKTETDKIQMVKNNQYVPFTKTLLSASMTTCDEAGGAGDSDFLKIDSQATTGTFSVNSIIMRPNPGSIDESTDVISISLQELNGGAIGILTNDFTDDKTFVQVIEGMGAPLSSYSGFFPQQITAQSQGTDDIVIRIFCDAKTTEDIGFSKIVVSGLKQADDTVNLSWSET